MADVVYKLAQVALAYGKRHLSVLKFAEVEHLLYKQAQAVEVGSYAAQLWIEGV